MKLSKLLLPLIILFAGCKEEPTIEDNPEILRLQSARVGTVQLKENETISQVPVDKNIIITFSNILEKSSAEASINLSAENGDPIAIAYSYIDNDKTIIVEVNSVLNRNALYTLKLDEIQSIENEVFPGAEFSFRTEQGTFNLLSAQMDGQDLTTSARIQNISTLPNLTLEFSDGISDNAALQDLITIKSLAGTKVSLSYQLDANNQQVMVSANEPLNNLRKYTLEVSSALQSNAQLAFTGFKNDFYTQIDSTYKFPEISDEELLTKVQEQTFKYFWDFAHPVSGLTRERNSSGDIVTIGGSGFGVMSIIVGVERGFITRAEGVDRLEKITDFLQNADRFHGVWPHWMNGNTGQTIPFSAQDDGADLVETAFMIQGLLAVRQYLDETNAQELSIINKITSLWEAVEWSWFQQTGENVLTWHWSPNNGFAINLKIRGWNEGLIIYTLAASSPTFPIDKEVYTIGWASNGGMVNGSSSYGINMPLGSNLGGPLFFAHYSFLAMDPRNLEDTYANYMDQNIAHASINRAYCIDNPNNYVGYSEGAWGLTASDTPDGYTAHAPDNDNGTITPTAAIASIPYTPSESMDAIRHFYYLMGDKLWGDYGFYDAYNITENWYANSYLAIDQGPIVIMIENYRTGIIWDLYMQDAEVQAGLTKLGFTF